MGFPPGGYKDGTDTLSKNQEEQEGVLDALEVWGGVHTYTEPTMKYTCLGRAIVDQNGGQVIPKGILKSDKVQDVKKIWPDSCVRWEMASIIALYPLDTHLREAWRR